MTLCELIDFIVNRIEDIVGAGAGMLADDVFKALFAEHLAFFIKRFPDAVGADGNDLSVG